MLVGHQEFKGATPNVVLCPANVSGNFKMAAAKPGLKKKYLYLNFQTK